jgi:hypothetical protein
MDSRRHVTLSFLKHLPAAENKEDNAKVKFQNANCQMLAWSLAMVPLPSF